jgi:hypothetical protein
MFASSQTKQKSGNQQRATNKATARNRYITKYNGARERAPRFCPRAFFSKSNLTYNAENISFIGP